MNGKRRPFSASFRKYLLGTDSCKPALKPSSLRQHTARSKDPFVPNVYICFYRTEKTNERVWTQVKNCLQLVWLERSGLGQVVLFIKKCDIRFFNTVLI